MEVASEALYHYRRLRFRARCIDSSAAHRVGVGYHGEWHFHSALGKRHRCRGGRDACVQGLAGNACLTGLTQTTLGCGLTSRWSARMGNKVPSPNRRSRGASLNR